MQPPSLVQHRSRQACPSITKPTSRVRVHKTAFQQPPTKQLVDEPGGQAAAAAVENGADHRRCHLLSQHGRPGFPSVVHCRVVSTDIVVSLNTRRRPPATTDGMCGVHGHQNQRNAAYPIQMRSKIRISSALSSKWKVSRPHPPGAEHGPAVCRIIAGWHYDCVPGRLYQFHDSVQQRVESLAGQAVELD